MSQTQHELAEEFPEMAEAIAQFNQSDAYFRKLTDLYHTLNCAVQRAEMDIEPTCEEHLSGMRKQRLALRDEIYTFLKKMTAPCGGVQLCTILSGYA